MGEHLVLIFVIQSEKSILGGEGKGPGVLASPPQASRVFQWGPWVWQILLSLSSLPVLAVAGDQVPSADADKRQTGRLAVARKQCWPDLWWRRAGDRCELIPDTFGSTHQEECSLSSLQNSQASQFPCKTLSVWMGRGPTQCFYRGLKSPAFQPLPWSRPLSVFWGAENIFSSGSLLSPKH